MASRTINTEAKACSIKTLSIIALFITPFSLVRCKSCIWFISRVTMVHVIGSVSVVRGADVGVGWYLVYLLAVRRPLPYALPPPDPPEPGQVMIAWWRSIQLD
ncbi:unnamed protein product [Danaus chrysippus]|uniref:(African queen) hypothetical protein n=1 Tax=Danaus chrysippus TaxID=151541 RepID=A0A8J2R6B7_9NEOP|nr:unnamed protein product [Danaus chrysippus]